MAHADLVRELTAVIASGQAVLFTGAGFSAQATDRSGRPLPDSREMVRDLWTILFGAEAPDDSSLADREYERFAADLHGAPFVFVCTTLDEIGCRAGTRS